MDPSKRRDGRRSEGHSYARLPPRGALPLPTPLPADKGSHALMGVPTFDDRRSPTIDAKLATMLEYCHARGLCYHCGEKWSRDHRCPKKIQVHVL